MVKRIALVLLCALFILNTAACGSGQKAPAAAENKQATAAAQPAAQPASTAPAATAKEADKKVTLKVAWWGNAERDKIYYKINDMFKAKNPNVEIVTQSPGYNDYWVKMATDYASGNPSDVVQFQANQIGEYCGKGVLIPLDPYVSSGAINLKNWNMDFVNTGKFKDKLYVLTLGMTARSLFFNKTYLDELGFKLWDADKTISWDEFEKLMISIQAKLPKGTYAALDIYNDSQTVWTWIRQMQPAGTEWVDKDGKFAPTVETLEGWYSLCERLRKAGAFPPIAWSKEMSAKPWQDDALINRKITLRFENANKFKLFTTNTKDELVIRRMPSAAGKPNPDADLLITSAYGISKASKIPDLAAKYIDFFANDIEAGKVFNAELGVPGSYDIQKALEPNLHKDDKTSFAYMNMISKGIIPFTPKPEGIWAIQDEINKAAEAVATGNMTPKKAAEYIISIANDTIKANLGKPGK